MRTTDLIGQLEKWNRLHTSGVIDENKCQELRKTIITDIKSWNSVKKVNEH